MHPNKAFRQSTRQRNIEFMQQRSFGLLSINAEPAPLISHIPFQISDDGTSLDAHLVRSNPILKLLDKPCAAVMAVTGADAYISPDWYQVDNQVPTWNYVAVHARGLLRRLDQSRLPEVLGNLSAHMEQRLLPKPPWTLDKLDQQVMSTLMKQIVPVSMDISDIAGTWKLSQNKSDEARIAAADSVAEHGVGLELHAIARLMRQQ